MKKYTNSFDNNCVRADFIVKNDFIIHIVAIYFLILLLYWSHISEYLMYLFIKGIFFTFYLLKQEKIPNLSKALK